MTQEEYLRKKEKVIAKVGGERAALVSYLKFLEERELFECCASVKDAIARFDAGETNVLNRLVGDA